MKGMTVIVKTVSSWVKVLIFKGEVLDEKDLQRLGMGAQLESLQARMRHLVLQTLLLRHQARQARLAIREIGQRSLDDNGPYTAEEIARLRKSDEGQEGMNAFLNKRKPRWVSRSEPRP